MKLQPFAITSPGQWACDRLFSGIELGKFDVRTFSFVGVQTSKRRPFSRALPRR